MLTENEERLFDISIEEGNKFFDVIIEEEDNKKYIIFEKNLPTYGNHNEYKLDWDLEQMLYMNDYHEHSIEGHILYRGEEETPYDEHSIEDYILYNEENKTPTVVFEIRYSLFEREEDIKKAIGLLIDLAKPLLYDPQKEKEDIISFIKALDSNKDYIQNQAIEKVEKLYEFFINQKQ